MKRSNLPLVTALKYEKGSCVMMKPDKRTLFLYTLTRMSGAILDRTSAVLCCRPICNKIASACDQHNQRNWDSDVVSCALHLSCVGPKLRTSIFFNSTKSLSLQRLKRSMHIEPVSRVPTGDPVPVTLICVVHRNGANRESCPQLSGFCRISRFW